MHEDNKIGRREEFSQPLAILFVRLCTIARSSGGLNAGGVGDGCGGVSGRRRGTVRASVRSVLS